MMRSRRRNRSNSDSAKMGTLEELSLIVSGWSRLFPAIVANGQGSGALCLELLPNAPVRGLNGRMGWTIERLGRWGGSHRLAIFELPQQLKQRSRRRHC